MIQDVENLEKMINSIQNNVNFNLSVTWAILGVVLTILTFAIGFSLKSFVDIRMEKEISNIRKDLKNELELEYKKYIKETPQVKWAKGTNFGQYSSKNYLPIHNLAIDNYNNLAYILNISSHLNKDKKLDYTHKVENDKIILDVSNYDISDGGIDWTVIWINEDFYK